MDINKNIKEQAQKRQQFKHQDQLIYEWDQTIDDINIYIKPPKFVLSKYQDELKKQLKPGQELPKLNIKIDPSHVQIGIKGNPPFINEDLDKLCAADESYWCIEDEELHIILQKAYKADVWTCVFKGHDKINPIIQQEMQKKLLLERFQEENPGFDFSSAEFNGMAPDPRNFMGGIKYN